MKLKSGLNAKYGLSDGPLWWTSRNSSGRNVGLMEIHPWRRINEILFWPGRQFAMIHATIRQGTLIFCTSLAQGDRDGDNIVVDHPPSITSLLVVELWGVLVVHTIIVKIIIKGSHNYHKDTDWRWVAARAAWTSRRTEGVVMFLKRLSRG